MIKIIIFEKFFFEKSLINIIEKFLKIFIESSQNLKTNKKKY